MNERAPTRTTVPSSIPANVRSSVRSVPEVSGTRFFAASETRQRQGQDQRREPAEEQDDPGGDVPRGVVVGQALEPRSRYSRTADENSYTISLNP